MSFYPLLFLQVHRYDYVYDVYRGKDSLKYQLRLKRGAITASSAFRRRVAIDAKPHRNWTKFLNIVCNQYCIFFFRYIHTCLWIFTLMPYLICRKKTKKSSLSFSLTGFRWLIYLMIRYSWLPGRTLSFLPQVSRAHIC